jgi:hypothetical protein
MMRSIAPGPPLHPCEVKYLRAEALSATEPIEPQCGRFLGDSSPYPASAGGSR